VNLASLRVPANFVVAGGSLTEISVANADGAELAHYNGQMWRWHEGEMSAELGIVGFYVSFKNGSGGIATVAVEVHVEGVSRSDWY
jgi:hypothetical protein